MGGRQPISLEEVQRRVFDAHGRTVKIVPETYLGVRFKATFEDVDYGRWETWVTNVTQGHGHAKRGREKGHQTNLMKYGSISPLGNRDVREKVEATNLERYGHKNVLGSDIIKERRDQTMIDRYGVKNPQQVPEVRSRTLATNVERLGVPHPYQSPEVLAKMEASNLERHGVKNPMQLEAVREKGRQTCLKRYGVENPAQDASINARALKNMHNVTELVHWKTGERLSCKASYEVAFVEWCNANMIDFDWQIKVVTPILTPKGKQSVYFIDARIKDGQFADTWIELKGTFNRKNGEVGKAKWEWFHETHPNSQLWTRDVLVGLGILGNRKKVA